MVPHALAHVGQLGDVILADPVEAELAEVGWSSASLRPPRDDEGGALSWPWQAAAVQEETVVISLQQVTLQGGSQLLHAGEALVPALQTGAPRLQLNGKFTQVRVLCAVCLVTRGHCKGEVAEVDGAPVDEVEAILGL